MRRRFQYEAFRKLPVKGSLESPLLSANSKGRDGLHRFPGLPVKAVCNEVFAAENDDNQHQQQRVDFLPDIGRIDAIFQLFKTFCDLIAVDSESVIQVLIRQSRQITFFRRGIHAERRDRIAIFLIDDLVVAWDERIFNRDQRFPCRDCEARLP